MRRITSQDNMRLVIRNLRARPAASALGFLFVASSAITLTHTGLTADALAGLLPSWAFYVFAVLYGIAGGLTLIGISRNRLNIEASGCALIITGVAARIIATVVVLPFVPAVAFNVVLLSVFAGAYLERFRQCINGERIIHIDYEINLKDDDESE